MSASNASPTKRKPLLRRLTSSKSTSSEKSTSSSFSHPKQDVVLQHKPTTLHAISSSAITDTTCNVPVIQLAPGVEVSLPTLVSAGSVLLVVLLVSRAIYTFSTSLVRGLILLLFLVGGVILAGGWEKRVIQGSAGHSGLLATPLERRSVDRTYSRSNTVGAGASTAVSSISTSDGNLISPYASSYSPASSRHPSRNNSLY